MGRKGDGWASVMARYTAAYSRLIRRLAEVETILRLAKDASKTHLIPLHLARVNALCRSGVVLLSSHIEGYIEDLGEIALDRIANRRLSKAKLSAGFRYYLSRDIINAIRQTSDPARIASKLEDLWVRDNHIWDARPNFSDPLPAQVFLFDFANPTHRRIKKFFNRFGIEDFERELARRLAVDFTACTNMVDQVIEQRNRIAHGDTVTTGTPTDLFQMIQLSKRYCKETDGVVGDWFKSQGCPIR
jgi:hypothetical protein